MFCSLKICKDEEDCTINKNKRQNDDDMHLKFKAREREIKRGEAEGAWCVEEDKMVDDKPEKSEWEKWDCE